MHAEKIYIFQDRYSWKKTIISRKDAGISNFKRVDIMNYYMWYKEGVKPSSIHRGKVFCSINTRFKQRTLIYQVAIGQ